MHVCGQTIRHTPMYNVHTHTHVYICVFTVINTKSMTVFNRKDQIDCMNYSPPVILVQFSSAISNVDNYSSSFIRDLDKITSHRFSLVIVASFLNAMNFSRRILASFCLNFYVALLFAYRIS